MFFRLYIIQGGKVAMKGGEGPLNYKLEDAADWLQEHFRKWRGKMHQVCEWWSCSKMASMPADLFWCAEFDVEPLFWKYISIKILFTQHLTYRLCLLLRQCLIMCTLQDLLEMIPADRTLHTFIFLEAIDILWKWENMIAASFGSTQGVRLRIIQTILRSPGVCTARVRTMYNAHTHSP